MIIIEICAIVATTAYITPKLVDWYGHRTRYNNRGLVKKTMNWIVNGDYS